MNSYMYLYEPCLNIMGGKRNDPGSTTVCVWPFVLVVMLKHSQTFQKPTSGFRITQGCYVYTRLTGTMVHPAKV